MYVYWFQILTVSIPLFELILYDFFSHLPKVIISASSEIYCRAIWKIEASYRAISKVATSYRAICKIMISYLRNLQKRSFLLCNLQGSSFLSCSLQDKFFIVQFAWF